MRDVNSSEFCPAIYFHISPGTSRYDRHKRWYKSGNNSTAVVQGDAGTPENANENGLDGIIYSDEDHIRYYSSRCS